MKKSWMKVVEMSAMVMVVMAAMFSWNMQGQENNNAVCKNLSMMSKHSEKYNDDFKTTDIFRINVKINSTINLSDIINDMTYITINIGDYSFWTLIDSEDVLICNIMKNTGHIKIFDSSCNTYININWKKNNDVYIRINSKNDMSTNIINLSCEDGKISGVIDYEFDIDNGNFNFNTSEITYKGNARLVGDNLLQFWNMTGKYIKN